MKKVPLDPEHRAGQKKNRKLLAAGLPLAALLSGISACDDCSTVTLESRLSGTPPQPKPDPELCEEARPCGEMPMSKEPAKKTVLIDQMSLSYRRFTTPGIFYPPNLVIQLQRYKVKAEDTWETLAKRYKTTVEIMLRINGIPIGTTWTVADSNVVPENLKLVPGQEINVPEIITYSYRTPGGNDDE